MMQISFRRNAEDDLRGIVEWYEGVATEVIGNILSDIYRSIDQLIDFPRSGSKVPRQRFRRLVTPTAPSPDSSLRAKRSNPGRAKPPWIASASGLAMTRLRVKSIGGW